MNIPLARAVGMALATVFTIFVIAVVAGYTGSIHLGIPGIVDFHMEGGGQLHVPLVEEVVQSPLPESLVAVRFLWFAFT